jgi:hypothetical protein
MDQLGQAYAITRVALGVAEVVLPGFARRRFGLPDDAVGRFDQRLVGVRDAAMGGGILAGRLRGSARHWYTACAVVDAVDGLTFAALAARGHVGKGRAAVVLVVGLGSAALGAALAVDAAGAEQIVGARKPALEAPVDEDVGYPPAG